MKSCEVILVSMIELLIFPIFTHKKVRSHKLVDLASRKPMEGNDDGADGGL